jgi:cytoskeletal protein CcmA (bactofilin family)
MTSNPAIPANWPEPAKADARRSIFAADLTIDGDVTSTGPVEVHGRVSGQVTAPEIHIASTGMFDGSAIASDLSVQGRISGYVDARNVSLAASAVVHSDVTNERIAIESGAELVGHLKRRR